MKKNGFTLVEILTVVVIIAVITTISSIGIAAVKEKINENLWESTISLIEKSAANYGEDNLNYLKDTNTTCEIDGKTKYKCIKVSVQYLIDKNYIKTNEEDKDGNKVLIDNRKSKDDAGYYVNDTHVLIYYEDNSVYAKYMNDDMGETNPPSDDTISVTFKSVNGTFLNGKNEIITNINKNSDGKYYLDAKDIPELKSDKGSWGTIIPKAGLIVVANTIFIYTYEKVNYICDSNAKLSDCIKSLYKSQGENNLYHHDGTIVNGINDGSYRYAGSYETTNNWICFGTDNSTCDDEHLYRIIGVFGDQVKLIKAYEGTETSLGSPATGRRTSLGKYYKGKSTVIHEYYLSDSGTNIWPESVLNINILNSTYLTKLGKTWTDKIAVSNWKVGGINLYQLSPSAVYQTEVVNPQAGEYGKNITHYNAKVGLMYVSDYGYAAGPEYWKNNLDNNSSDEYRNNNWMFMGIYEFTITREVLFPEAIYIVNAAGSFQGIGPSTSVAVRPSFYLNSSIEYKSGIGTENDPIIIN